MRNAGAINPPTDPFDSVPLPTPANGRKPQAPGLPPGVSPDIFGSRGRPAPQPSGPTALPPVAPPPQPWPMTEAQRQEPVPPPAPVFGLPEPPERLSGGFEPEPPRRRRRLLVLAVVVGVLMLLAYVVPAVLMSGSVLRGTTVSGVEIGGLTATEAADKLRNELSAKVDRPITVTAPGGTETIQPIQAGLELDVPGTIEQAPSGFPSPAEVWRGLTGATELAPMVSVDAAKLGEAVDELAARFDKAAREGRVSFKELKPVAVGPREGQVIDRDGAEKVITDAFLGSRALVALPVKTDYPKTTPEAVRKAAATAPQALSAPITLTVAGRQAQLPVATIAAHLTFVSDGKGRLEPRFDARQAVAGVESQLIDAAQAPRDATYEVVNGALQFVSARRGRGVDDKKLAQDVAAMIAADGGRTIPVELATVAPRVTDSQVRALGIKEKVSEFTTSHGCCEGRVTNIHLMADALDGYLVKPGEMFSINGIVGERTSAKGYVPAGQIVSGKLEDGVGGGVSQFATTMYNAAFFGGYEDVTHLAHAYYISRYPAGREATVFWPTVDLKWRNDSEYGVLVNTSYTGSTITVSLWSTKRYEIRAQASQQYNPTDFESKTSTDPECKPMAGGPGFTIDVTRVFLQDGKELKREKKTTRYNPQQKLTCLG